MTRTVALLAVLAVGGMIAALAVGLGPVAAQETPANETAEAPGPGAQLAGVVAVQGVEVRGELAERRFGHQVATARSNASRVGVVAERVEQLQAETAAIRERRQALLAARANGSIGPAAFRAEMAALAARGGTIETAAERTGSVAAGLDRERLAERGVNATAIDRLRTEARNATGPEAAAIGRSIAGNDVGRGLGPAAGPRGGPFDTPPGRNRTTEDGVSVTLETPTRGGGAGGPPERTTGRPTTRGPPTATPTEVLP